MKHVFVGGGGAGSRAFSLFTVTCGRSTTYSLAPCTASLILPPNPAWTPTPPQPCLTSAQWGWSQARRPVFESSQSSGAGSRDMRLSPGGGKRPPPSHWKSRSSVIAMVNIVLHVPLFTSQLRWQKPVSLRHQTAPGGYVV